MKIILATLYLLPFLSFSQIKTDHINNVSIINLISTPEKYQDKKVRIIGYVNVEFESNAIYLHKEDYEQNLSRNALWITLTEAQKNDIRYNKNMRYLIIEGIFDKHNTGHMGLFNSGGIKDISRIGKWTNRKEIQQFRKKAKANSLKNK